MVEEFKLREKMAEEFILRERAVDAYKNKSLMGYYYPEEAIEEFIRKLDEIIIQEINKTIGSVDFDLNNLYDRINIRKRKLARGLK